MTALEEKPLDSVADIVRGVTFSKKDVSSFPSDGLTPVLRAGNIHDELLLDKNLVYVINSQISAKQKLRAGDIIMCTSSGSADVVGKTAYLDQDWDGSFGAFCAVVRSRNGKCSSRYLFHYLQTPAFKAWTRNSSGINIKNIRKTELDKFRIPLPPVGEQRRIATILDKADAIRRKRQQALSFADDLLKSAFLELFGDPVTNTKELPKIALGELIKVSSGNGLTAKNMDAEGTHPVYGGNGVNGYHAEYMFEDPQLVIGRVGVYCGAVHLTEPKSWITDNALYIREYKRPVNLTYLEWALRFADLNQYAGRAAQPLISGGRIYPIEIVFPDETQQNKFASFVRRQKPLLDRLNQDCRDAVDLFTSLSRRAFRGEV